MLSKISYINIIFLFTKLSFPLTKWWDDCVMDCLPLSCLEKKKKYLEIHPTGALTVNDFDSFANFYRTDEFSVMSESYTFEISHSVRYVLF